MTEYLRVKDPVSGAEYTYTREQMAATGLTDADVIDKDPLGVDGQPAPAKPRLAPGETLPGSAPDLRRTAVADLKAEITARNADRAPEDQIKVEAPGNKPELVAALAADDEAQNATPKTTEAPSPGDSDGQSPAAPEEES